MCFTHLKLWLAAATRKCELVKKILAIFVSNIQVCMTNKTAKNGYRHHLHSNPLIAGAAYIRVFSFY